MTQPTLFLAHGNPLLALYQNHPFNQMLKNLTSNFKDAKGIICVSGHWESPRTTITGAAHPPIIHDFYGFPPELYEIKPDLKGDVALSKEIAKYLDIIIDEHRGFDHGTWGVLHTSPISIPVFQVSIGQDKSLQEHYDFAKKFQGLREQGYIIIGSGNIVHNLREINFDLEASTSWAQEFESTMQEVIEEKKVDVLINPQQIPNWQRAIPEFSHYIPLLYVMSSSFEAEHFETIYKQIQNGAVSMYSCMTKN